MKTPVQIIILLALLAGGGYYGFQQYRAAQAARLAQVARASEAAHRAVTVQQAQDFAKQQAADNAKRQEIGVALQSLKVSSLILGQPGMVIIGKQEYAEGDQIPLPKGHKARITKVQEDGVLLACEGLAFHLDPPAAPDLAASRKPR